MDSEWIGWRAVDVHRGGHWGQDRTGQDSVSGWGGAFIQVEDGPQSVEKPQQGTPPLLPPVTTVTSPFTSHLLSAAMVEEEEEVGGAGQVRPGPQTRSHHSPHSPQCHPTHSTALHLGLCSSSLLPLCPTSPPLSPVTFSALFPPPSSCPSIPSINISHTPSPIHPLHSSPSSAGLSLLQLPPLLRSSPVTTVMTRCYLSRYSG